MCGTTSTYIMVRNPSVVATLNIVTTMQPVMLVTVATLVLGFYSICSATPNLKHLYELQRELPAQHVFVRTYRSPTLPLYQNGLY